MKMLIFANETKIYFIVIMSKNTLAVLTTLFMTLSASAENINFEYDNYDMGVLNPVSAEKQIYNSLIENSNGAKRKKA